MLYFCSLPKEKQIGLSPSGKATDFDSVTRGFESRQPSQVAASPCGSPRLSFPKAAASPCGLPLLSAKSHARFGCSVASALADASLSLPAFCGKTIAQRPCSSAKALRAPRIAGRSFFWRNPPFHFRFIARSRALSSREMQRDSSIFWTALLYVQSSNAVVSRKANVLSRYFAIAVAAAHAAPIL